MKEFKSLYNAVKWYKKSPEYQYSVDHARSYDDSARILTDRQAFARFFLEHIGSKPGKTLEIAAGTGLVSEVLQEKIQELYFTDISLPASNILKEKVGKNAKVVLADFFHLPFISESFDTLVCVGGYRYVPPEGKLAFWNEVKRVLQPEGRFFIAQFYPRGASFQGNDINVDRFLINNDFYLNSMRGYTARITMKSLRVQSGKYLSFEYILHKETSH